MPYLLQGAVESVATIAAICQQSLRLRKLADLTYGREKLKGRRVESLSVDCR